MIKTVKDVLQKREYLLKQLDRMNHGREVFTYYDRSEMNCVVVLTDQIAKEFLERNYVFNTHFVPNGLPGVGEATGDIVKHEGKDYLILHLGVMFGNLMGFQLIRPHEILYREWYKRKAELDQRVRKFFDDVRAVNSKCFDIEALKFPNGWNNTEVGWNWLGTPSASFLEALDTIVDIARKQREKDLSAVAKIASELKRELSPYLIFPELMSDIRKKARHKGIPVIEDDLLVFHKPAASGEAGLHIHNAGDDLIKALPSENDIGLIAAQAGTIPIKHFGGGNLQGEHYVFLLPKTPFFLKVKELVFSNQ